MKYVQGACVRIYRLCRCFLLLDLVLGEEMFFLFATAADLSSFSSFRPTFAFLAIRRSRESVATWLLLSERFRDTDSSEIFRREFEEPSLVRADARGEEATQLLSILCVSSSIAVKLSRPPRLSRRSSFSTIRARFASS